MKEVFKDIPGYEGIYQVSNLGRVKSLERVVKHSRCGFLTLKEKIMKTSDDGRGYLKLVLILNKKQKCYRVHKLVAMAFLNHTPCGHKLVVDHINHDKTDNRVENLRIVTSRVNTNHRKKKGTSKYPGVSWYRNAEKWCAEIYINKERKHLGLFEDEHEAYQVYQKALDKIEQKYDDNRNNIKKTLLG